MNETETEAERVLRVVRTRMDMDEAAEALTAQHASPAVIVGVVTAGPHMADPVVSWSPLLDRESVPAILRLAADALERMNASKNN